MPRTKNTPATRKRRKAIIKQAKGYFGNKHTHFKKAKEQTMRAWACAFHDRKKKKNLFRQIWIQRLNAAVREYKMTYGLFWNTLRKLNIKHNRKMLSELAIRYPEMFKQIVKKVQHSLSHPKS